MMICDKCKSPLPGNQEYAFRNRCICSSKSGSLVYRLGDVINKSRIFADKLGARPYKVRLIWTKWSGGTIGNGEEYIHKELLLKPTPKISSRSSLTRSGLSTGTFEEGDLKLNEISPRIPEETLIGYLDKKPLDPDTSFFWEIETGKDPNNGRIIRRKFVPISAPSNEGFGYSIQLAKIAGDRSPDGDLKGIIGDMYA